MDPASAAHAPVVCAGQLLGRPVRSFHHKRVEQLQADRRPIPVRVDKTYAAPLPVACPRCGGVFHFTRVATQYQEDLPVVSPDETGWRVGAVLH